MELKDKLYNLTIGLIFCGSFLGKITGIVEFKYMIYLLTLSIGTYFCHKYGIKKMHILPSYILAYILLILYGSLSCLSLDFNSIAYIVFWLCAVSLFLPYCDFAVNMKVLNLLFVISQLAIIPNLYIDFSLSAFFKSATSTVETNTPNFIFALFFIYHLFKGNKFYAVLNFCCIIIFFKRIIVIAVLICIILYVVHRIYGQKKTVKINPLLFVTANFLYLYITIAFANGNFNKMLHQLTGISVGELSMGRNTLYKLVGNDFVHSDLFNIVFGHGTASCSNFLMRYRIGDLHNDILKLAYEQGIVVFSLFIYLLYKHAKTWFGLSLTIMMNIFFLTDNTLIYTMVSLIYFLVYQEYEKGQNILISQRNYR